MWPCTWNQATATTLPSDQELLRSHVLTCAPVNPEADQTTACRLDCVRPGTKLGGDSWESPDCWLRLPPAPVPSSPSSPSVAASLLFRVADLQPHDPPPPHQHKHTHTHTPLPFSFCFVSFGISSHFEMHLCSGQWNITHHQNLDLSAKRLSTALQQEELACLTGSRLGASAAVLHRSSLVYF